jgi:hypothetical protein
MFARTAGWAPAYDRQASALAELYESLSFEDCHRDMLDLVPETPGGVLDVGAGSTSARPGYRRLDVPP